MIVLSADVRSSARAMASRNCARFSASTDSTEKLKPLNVALAGPTALEERERRERRRGEARSAAARAFTQRVNLWRLDPTVRAVVLSRRLGSVAGQLLAAGRVRLYHDQALVKEPGGGPTPWHQDQVYWPLDASGALTIWIALGRVDKTMGPLRFARGSQLRVQLGVPHLKEPDQRTRAQMAARGMHFREAAALAKDVQKARRLLVGLRKLAALVNDDAPRTR